MPCSVAQVNKVPAARQNPTASLCFRKLTCRQYRRTLLSIPPHASAGWVVNVARSRLRGASPSPSMGVSSAATETGQDKSKNRNSLAGWSNHCMFCAHTKAYNRQVLHAEYICSSPIAKSCGIAQTDDLDQVAHWEKLGELLSQRLGHPTGDDASEQQRYTYFLCFLTLILRCRTSFCSLPFLDLQGTCISVLPSHIPLAASATART